MCVLVVVEFVFVWRFIDRFECSDLFSISFMSEFVFFYISVITLCFSLPFGPSFVRLA